MEFIKDPSLVLDLPFRRLDGASFMDKSAYGHKCTNFGSKWTPHGRSFDGVDDYVTIPNTILPDPLAFTVSGWFFNKGENATVEDWQGIVDLRGQYNIFVGLYEQDNATNPGAVYFNIWDGTTSHNLFSTNLAINVWHFFTIIWDGTTQRLYIGDVEVGSQTAANPAVFAWPVQSRIGKDHTDINRGWFNGLIDEVHIYNRALSPLEIQHNYLATRFRYS